MSSLLDMAKDTEQRLKAQASATDAMLTREFSEHERRVSEALRSSEQTISAAIAGHTEGMNAALQAHRKNVLRLVAQRWLAFIAFSVLLLATSSGVLWLQGQMIASRWDDISRLNRDIAQQRVTLSTLNAKTWGVTTHEDGNGRFLVLPTGTTADRKDWTLGEGKKARHAVRLVKE
ncbi:MbeB family mobilization protein [Serratia nevei]|uniref:MbeB family mobilization protein n=1 Tax=Serratia nevei TaxID=2703794 RepID=UPI003F77430D